MEGKEKGEEEVDGGEGEGGITYYYESMNDILTVSGCSGEGAQ